MPGWEGERVPPGFGKSLLAHIEGLRPFEPAELLSLMKTLQLRPHEGKKEAGD